jgi:hypothetical protein
MASDEVIDCATQLELLVGWYNGCEAVFNKNRLLCGELSGGEREYFFGWWL